MNNVFVFIIALFREKLIRTSSMAVSMNSAGTTQYASGYFGK